MNIQKWLKWNKGWCQNWSHLHLKAAGEPTALTIQRTVEFHHLGHQKVYSKWRWSVILMITLQTCHKKMSPFFRRLFHPLPSCQRTGRGHNTNESEYQDIYFKPVKTFSVRCKNLPTINTFLSYKQNHAAIFLSTWRINMSDFSLASNSFLPFIEYTWQCYFLAKHTSLYGMSLILKEFQLWNIIH